MWNDSLQTISFDYTPFTFISFSVSLNSRLATSILTLPHISLFVFSFIAIFLFSLLWAFTDCFWSSLKRECVVWVENYICMLERGLRVFVGFGKDPGFFFFSFWEGGMRKQRNNKKGFLDRRKVRVVEVIFLLIFFPSMWYTSSWFSSLFFCMYKPLD